MNKLKDDFKIIVPIWVIGGVFGFLFEVLFYYFDKGYLMNRGTTFGPWIPIYGFGAIFIYLLTKKFKEKRLKVFLISLIVCGLLEFLTAYLLFHFWHIRLWDYNTEILSFGNIGGYICLRSILMWGLCGVLLTSIIIPTIEKLYSRFNKKKVFVSFSVLGSIFLIDFIINIII